MRSILSFFFFFNDTATTEIYTLSLHDALPICASDERGVYAGALELRACEGGLLRRLESADQDPAAHAPTDRRHPPPTQGGDVGRGIERERVRGAQQVALAARDQAAVPHRRTPGRRRVARGIRAHQYAIPHRSRSVERDRRHEGASPPPPPPPPPA